MKLEEVIKASRLTEQTTGLKKAMVTIPDLKEKRQSTMLSAETTGLTEAAGMTTKPKNMTKTTTQIA